MAVELTEVEEFAVLTLNRLEALNALDAATITPRPFSPKSMEFLSVFL